MFSVQLPRAIFRMEAIWIFWLRLTGKDISKADIGCFSSGIGLD